MESDISKILQVFLQALAVAAIPILVKLAADFIRAKIEEMARHIDDDNRYLIAEAVEIAVKKGLKLPLVWNCGGYENVEVVKLLDGVVDIYMPDMKYSEPDPARKYSTAPDYFDRCREAVKEISFSIEEGEFVGFIGPNGAGKTTTLKMLSGILLPTSGEASVRWIRARVCSTKSCRWAAISARASERIRPRRSSASWWTSLVPQGPKIRTSPIRVMATPSSASPAADRSAPVLANPRPRPLARTMGLAPIWARPPSPWRTWGTMISTPCQPLSNRPAWSL